MRSPLHRAAGLAALAFALGAALVLAPGSATAEPVRVASEAFGQPVEIEVRNLDGPRAERAIEEALKEISAIASLTDPTGAGTDGLGALNRSPAEGVVLDRRLLRLLARARDFCLWSRGAHNPLGGRTLLLWGFHGEAEARPTPGNLLQARAPDCRNLRLDAETARARRPLSASVDLWGFARGFAVDRAMETLQDFGATNAWVELGTFYRGLGKGPDGARGWPVSFEDRDELAESVKQVWLEDQALAYVHQIHRPLTIAGDVYAPFLDQRTGEPGEGVRGAIVVTDLTVDAQALAVSLSILGTREGQMRLGGLKPTPAVLWLLGEGDEGPPLLAASHWSLARAN